jgi:S-adenosyl methyltransferase
VIAHAPALLTRDGRTTVALADIRDPASLLVALHLDGLIEFAEPVGKMESVTER